jgi:hypothetical protein
MLPATSRLLLPASLCALLGASCGRAHEPAPAAAGPAAQAEPEPEVVPAGARRVLELAGGVRVEIVAEGRGPVVAAGDELLLDYLVSYVPPTPGAEPAKESKDKGQPDGEKKDKDKAHAKDAGKGKGPGASKDHAAKPAHEAAHEPGPDAHAPEKPVELGGAQPSVAAEAHTEAKPAAHEAPEDKGEAKPAAGAEPQPAAQAEAKPEPETAAGAAPATEGTAPPPEPAPKPLEPVVVASTRSFGQPVRVRAGQRGELLPALSGALVGLRAGTRAIVHLPAEKAYGAAGLPAAGIPPGAPIEAEIRIRKVLP